MAKSEESFVALANSEKFNCLRRHRFGRQSGTARRVSVRERRRRFRRAAAGHIDVVGLHGDGHRVAPSHLRPTNQLGPTSDQLEPRRRRLAGAGGDWRQTLSPPRRRANPPRAFASGLACVDRRPNDDEERGGGIVERHARRPQSRRQSRALGRLACSRRPPSSLRSSVGSMGFVSTRGGGGVDDRSGGVERRNERRRRRRRRREDRRTRPPRASRGEQELGVVVLQQHGLPKPLGRLDQPSTGRASGFLR